MDIDRMPFVKNAMSDTDIYTNLKGLQSIKNEASQDAALKKVAQQFESLFVNMMMKNMRAANAVFEEGNLFNSNESKFYRDMLDHQRALTMSQGRGLGIADVLYRQMSKTYGKGEADASAPLGKSLTSYKDQRVESRRPNPVEDTHQEPRVTFTQSPQEFVDTLIPYAKKAAKALGVDHLLLVAQSALETGWGKHVLANKNGESSNNLFNIKAGSEWKKESTTLETVEYSEGVIKKENSEFRVYDDIAESFSDYVEFVLGSQRYQHAVDSASDVKKYIQELHKAGYATDPKYSQKVLSVYDRVADIAKTPMGNDGRDSGV